MALRKYGSSNFKFEILEIGENEFYGLTIAESMYITWLKPKYNSTLGGEGTLGLKRPPFTENHKKLISIARSGKKLSVDHRKLLSVRKLGIKRNPLSDEQKLKISLSLTGGKRSKETRLKMSISGKNRNKSQLVQDIGIEPISSSL